MLRCTLVGLAVCLVTVNAVGIPLTVTEDQINDATSKNNLEGLFRQNVQAHPVVMFTKSTCSLSRKARDLMNENYPNVDYHYYEWDTQPLGLYFLYPSILKSGTTKTPQIWMCDEFVGGTPALRTMHANGEVLQKVQNCARRK